jgi:hypothetical protein
MQETGPRTGRHYFGRHAGPRIRSGGHPEDPIPVITWIPASAGMTNHFATVQAVPRLPRPVPDRDGEGAGFLPSQMGTLIIEKRPLQGFSLGKES